MRITCVDWIIIAFFISGLIVVGYLTKGLAKSVSDFTIAGRKLRMWLGLSASSAEGLAIASVATIGQQGYLHGLSYIWLLLISMAISIPIFGVIGFGIKRYRATGVQTLPQYYEMRYSRGVRILAGISIVVGGVLNMAIFPIVAAQFLTTFIGFSETVAIAGITFQTTYLVMFILIVLSLFFVLTGGFVTVVITNYVQAIVMGIAVFATTYLCLRSFGGKEISDITGSMYNVLHSVRGEGAFNPFGTGSYGIVWILFFIASNIYGVLAFPPSLATTSGAETPEVARKMFLIRILSNNGRVLCVLLWGVGALAVLGTSVPAGLDTEIYQRTLTPLYLAQIVPPVLIGIVIAGLLFAEIGTTDGYLICWSSIIVNDVICSIKRIPYSTKQHVLVFRVTLVGLAVFLFLWGIYYKPSESILTYMYLTGAIFTGAGIISFYGLYWKRTSTLAAYSALIICMVVPLADIFLKQHWQNMPLLCHWRTAYPLKGEESGLIAIVLSMAAIHVLSMFSKKKTHFVDYGKKLKENEAESD